MNMFQEREKREQDAIIFLAVQDGNCGRREYFFLEKSIRRQCFETILGISSHRLDKAGAIDRRFKDARDPTKPTTLTASIDSFCMMTLQQFSRAFATQVPELCHVSQKFHLQANTPTKIVIWPLFSLILTCKAARFVYDRKTKGPQKARASKKQQDSDTDHWEGGKNIHEWHGGWQQWWGDGLHAGPQHIFSWSTWARPEDLVFLILIKQIFLGLLHFTVFDGWSL